MAYDIPFLYFAEGGADDTAGDSAVYPASAFRGSDPASASSSTLYFKPQVIGDAVATGDFNDKVVVTHTGVKHSVFMRALAKAINNPAKTARDGFIVVADNNNGTGVGANVGVTGWDVTITYAA